MIRVFAVAACATLAFALDPDRTIAQFYHTAWTIEDGAPSAIFRLAQTKDGYLWLATFGGLFHFDGVRFERYQPEQGDPFPSQDIVGLLATPDGGLWITFRPYGAAFLKNGRCHSYGERDGLPLGTIYGLARDREGAIWAGTSRGLFRFTNSRWEKIGAEWGFLAAQAFRLFVDNQGKLWIEGGTDLYCLPPGAHSFQMRKAENFWSMHQSPDGTLWMWVGNGTRAVYGRLAEFHDGSKVALGPTLSLQLVDRDGGMWMSASDADGLCRLANPAGLPNALIDSSSGALQKFTRQDGLTGDSVVDGLEDAEGNVWIATTNGLDRFRRKNVFQGPFSTKTAVYDALLMTDRKGIVWEDYGPWLAPADGGPRSREGLPLAPPIRSPGGLTRMTCRWLDSEGTLWLGGPASAIVRWTGGRFENVEFPYKELARGIWDVQSITVDRAGDLWVSIQQHGVYRRHDGVWTQYGNLPGWPKTTPVILWTDAKGRVWFGYTGNQIVLLDRDRMRTLSSSDGLHVGNVLAIGGRGDHIWAAGQFGLALFNGGKFHTIAGEADADFRGVSGVVETAGGDFWLNQQTGVARIPAREIASRLRDPHHKLQYDLFDFRDGVKGTATQFRPLPSAVEGSDGRIWLSGSSGVYWIDPARIYRNPVPPPVAIEAIYSGDRRFPSIEAPRLPKQPQNVRIEYTALSLSIPERVRFRYQLEGYDKDWQDGGTRRFASYTKLPPGHFQFRVIAANDSGVWNEAGATLDFSVAPAYYQTHWFQAACIVAFLASLWGLYRLRLRQLAHQMTNQFNVRLEERVGERTRIARELHDTLLQSFQGLLFELQAARKLFVRRPGDAMRTLDGAIGSAEAAIAEGRDAIQDLRVGSDVRSDLAAMLRATGKELSDAQNPPGNLAAFRLMVEGSPQTLSPVLQDEIYRIGREILRNAFHHARAAKIEAEIRYDDRMLRLRIRDDGIGIDPKVLGEGARPGHWGLSGIRERAKVVGAKLDFWSEAGAGTEVQVTVPAAIAYAKTRKVRAFRWFRKTARSHGD